MVLVFGLVIIIREGLPVCCCAPCDQDVGVMAWSSGCLYPGCGL